MGNPGKTEQAPSALALPGAWEVGPKLPPADDSPCGELQPNREGPARCPFPGQDLIKAAVRAGAARGLQFGVNEAAEAGPKVHTSRVPPKRVYATLYLHMPKMAPGPHFGLMTNIKEGGRPVWLHLDNFKNEVQAYARSTGKGHREIAADLGIGLAFFRNILYGQKKPGTATLSRAAALFRCPLTNFLDDPGALIETEDVRELTEAQRFQAKVIIRDMRAEDLTDTDWQVLFEDYIHSRDRLRALKARK